MAQNDGTMHFHKRDNIWVVVGGADKGGVIVRAGEELTSDKYDVRLSYGAMVEKIELVGERLHYRIVPKAIFVDQSVADDWEGPDEGWVSIKMKGKDLVVPMMPASLYELAPSGDPPSMTFYAISDCHVERKQNMEWLANLPKFSRATVLVAGDLANSLAQIKESLELFKAKFDHVFYCYGNHDSWCLKSQSDASLPPYNTSFEKLDRIRGICEEVGVLTTATLIENVWVVPVLGWYHRSWDTEPSLQPPPGKKLIKDPLQGEDLATDSMACKFGSFKPASEDLAHQLDKQNEKWGVWPLPAELQELLEQPRESRQQFIISFSHFLPRLELIPEKRFLFQPNLAQIVGSKYLRKRVDSLRPNLHVFGHTHFPWDMTLDDGVRYRSWPLAMPEEQLRRIDGFPSQSTEEWHPLPVFDSLGRHYPTHEACWYSLLYTRIPREPSSHYMASFVRSVWCPCAAEVPVSIHSPGNLLKASTEENEERRARTARAAKRSSKREMERDMRSGA